MSERAQQADDADATVVLPTPGRKRSAFAPSIERQAAVADLAALGGLNPLVEAANPILAAVPQIRHALRHPDPAALHERLKEQVDGFERSALAAGIAEDQVQTARFALCALLDDSAAATPWGRQWVSLGLLADEEAGEKFFALLDEMLGDPERNAELLEFFYVCLALGFEGRHRGGEGGRTALAQVRTRLYEFIEQRQGRKSTDLSARWRGAEVRQKGVSGALALWGVAAGCLFILAVLYFGYSVLLGARSDPVARDLARLKLSGTASAAAPKAPLKPGEVSVAAQLTKTIGGADVEVREVGDGAVILLKGDRLFAAGSSRPDAKVQPVIEKVAAALDKLPGSVIVTGHTDDLPIRTARFPSNWELSTERARNVVAMMAAEMKDPARLRAEGLADSEPLVPNDNAANRAKNRRVAILLRSGS